MQSDTIVGPTSRTSDSASSLMSIGQGNDSSLMARVLARIFGLPGFAALRSELDAAPAEGWFGRRILNVMNVRVRVEPKPDMPAEGPLVIVANHPFGAIEGLALLDAVRAIREDVKVLANGILEGVPEMREHCFFVDPFGGEGSGQRNFGPVTRAFRWLRSGHALIVFPAGEVASYSLSTGRVQDAPWLPLIGGLIHRTSAKVVPVFIPGSNRWFFHAAGLIHPRLRTLLLGREFLAQRGSTIVLQFGKTLAYPKLRGIEGAQALTTYLRERCHMISLAKALSESNKGAKLPSKQEPVAEPVAANIVAREIDSLPIEQVLLHSKGFRVVHAAARQIPCTMREVGRLREHTFRKVGEGTGHAVDLDAFDARYEHLLVWSETNREIAGACRLGPTDQILPRSGLEGMYTSTLFRFQESFADELGPSLELGRSFVRPEYQTSPTAIRLLWKGIGHYVALYPRYRFLWGPVSVSNEYTPASRRLIVAFLREHAFLPSLARHVRPRTPVSLRGLDAFHHAKPFLRSDIDELSSLVSDLEPDRKGVPPLLRQYVKLGGRFAGFNLDPAFSNVVDGLVVVDLAMAERAVLASYFPAEGLQQFIDHHRPDRDSVPTPPVWFPEPCPVRS